MDLKFKSNEARRFYEAMAKHKLILKEQKELQVQDITQRCVKRSLLHEEKCKEKE